MNKINAICKTKFECNCDGLACSLIFPDNKELKDKLRLLLVDIINNCPHRDKYNIKFELRK